MTFCIKLKSTGARIVVDSDANAEAPRDVKTVLYRPDADYLSSIPDGPQTFFPVAARDGEYVVAAFGEKTIGTAFYPSDTGLSPRGVRSRVESELRTLSVYLFDRVFVAAKITSDGELFDSVGNCYAVEDIRGLYLSREERAEIEARWSEIVDTFRVNGLA